MKRLVAILSALAAIGGVTACSDDAEPTASSAGSGAGDASTASAAKPKGAAATYGTPTSDQVAEEIAATVQTYNVAMSAENGAKACAALATSMKKALGQFAKGEKEPPCSKMVLGLTSTFPEKYVRNMAQSTVIAVREDKGQVLAFYDIPDIEKELPYPMKLEDGTWKIGVFGEPSR